MKNMFYKKFKSLKIESIHKWILSKVTLNNKETS